MKIIKWFTEKMKMMKKDLENRYIADRKHSKDQIKTLSAGIVKQHQDIQKHYLPQLQQLFSENIKLQHQVYETARAYNSLLQWGMRAEEMGIDITDIKLPEKQPYEGFELKTEVLESGKVKETIKLREKKPGKK